MIRETQSLLLTLLGGALIRLAVGDAFLRYVREWMRPGLLAAGAILVLVGLLSLRRERRPGPEDAEPHHGPWVAWLLVLPVLAVFLVAPPALGSYTAARAPAPAVAEPVDDGFEPLPAGDPVTVSLTDYSVRTIWDRGRSLTGRQVRLVGFVTPRRAGGFHVTRIAITCCAADARSVRVTVRDAPATFPADTWVAVTGRYGGLDAAVGGNEQIPVLIADSVERAPVPAEPYEN